MAEPCNPGRANLDSNELFWLAGLLEGEGYFCTINSKVKGKIYRYPKITLAMTDYDAVLRTAKLMGSDYVQKVNNKRGKKQVYRCFALGENAANLMAAIFPIMGERRQAKIREILLEWNAKPDPNFSRQLSMKLSVKNRKRNIGGKFLPNF